MGCPHQLLLFVALNSFAMSVSKIRLPVGITNFAHLVKSNHTFVDKTEFIKEIMCDSAKVTLITRPRRFGKSLSLSMLQYFLESRKSRSNKSHANIFSGLKVSQDKEFCASHMNQYPVVYISFRGINATNYHTAECKIFEMIKQVYVEHRFLLEENTLNAYNTLKFGMILNGTASIDNLKTAIVSLCEFLGNKKPLIKAKKGVVLLIDDYDTPLQTAYLNSYLQEMDHLISRIISCLQSSPYLHKAVVMGSNAIATEILSRSNSVICTVLNKNHAQYFGFTLGELTNLLAKMGSAIKQTDMDRWYRFNFSKTVVYNPWSILSCLENNGRTGPYWTRTIGSKLVLDLLSLVGISEAASFKYLLKDGTINHEIHEKISFKRLKTEEEYFWTALVHAGYLSGSYICRDSYRAIYSLQIPNEESKRVLASWYGERFSEGVRKAFKDMDSFLVNVMNSDIKKIEGFILKCLKESGMYYDFTKPAGERRYHDYLRRLFNPLLKEQYTIIYHRREGSIYVGRRRRYDFVLVPKNKSVTGMILDLAVTKEARDLKKTAERALTRIKDHNFTSEFAGCEKVIAAGVALYRQSIKLDFEVLHV